MQSLSSLTRTKQHTLVLFLCSCTVLCLLNCSANISHAQSAVSAAQITIRNSKDIGYADASAVSELRAYLKATSLASWNGMTAVGTVKMAGTDNPWPTTLWFLNGNRTRMEVSVQNGTDVYVFNGTHGYRRTAGSKINTLSPSRATVGLAQVGLVGDVLNNINAYAVVDHGTVVRDGSTFHQIALDTELPPAEVVPGSPNRVSLALDFESATHLLVRISTEVNIVGAGNHRFAHVVDFSNYQAFGNVTLPATINESLDGVQTLSIQISSVDTSQLPSPEQF